IARFAILPRLDHRSERDVERPHYSDLGSDLRLGAADALHQHAQRIDQAAPQRPIGEARGAADEVACLVFEFRSNASRQSIRGGLAIRLGAGRGETERTRRVLEPATGWGL